MIKKYEQITHTNELSTKYTELYTEYRNLKVAEAGIRYRTKNYKWQPILHLIFFYQSPQTTITIILRVHLLVTSLDI
jgi:hypothetical protein